MGGSTVTTYSKVEQSGLYRCGDCDAPLKLDEGEEAPKCHNCHRAGKPVTWHMVRRRIGFTAEPTWPVY